MIDPTVSTHGGSTTSLSKLSIAYIGPESGTCLHRRRALERLGHRVAQIDPFDALPWPTLSSRWAFHTGWLGTQSLVAAHLGRVLGERHFDVLWVDSGEAIGPNLLARLKKQAQVTLLLNNDNPFVARDGKRWRLLHRSLPLYDLIATPRSSNAEAAIRTGCRHVITVGFAADEIAHQPPPLLNEPSGIVFVGTWMPERGLPLLRLIERGLPLKIYGPRWRKCPEYAALEPHIVEGGLGDEAYARIIAGAQIAIGLLSKGNEDLHTTRSLEIPALGTVLAAERTVDHVAMYEDGLEAIFWDDAEECATRCLQLLADPARLRRMAAAGRRRVIANAAYNETLVTRILDAALDSAASGDGR